jgi:peptidoglycan hydrolase CwlO-like protein
LGQAQRAIEDKNKQVEKHMASIKELEANVQGLKQELADYKLRAKKVLQQREATIHELTEKLSSPGTATFVSSGCPRPADSRPLHNRRCERGGR